MTTTDARALDASPELDERVCVALGIPGRATYFASNDGGNSGYLFSPYRSEVEEFIAGYRQRMPDSAPARCEVHTSTVYPAVSSDPAADYEVLRHVRETWDTDAQYQFAHALAELYRPRKEGNHPILRYMPGDYSRAALAVMEGE